MYEWPEDFWPHQLRGCSEVVDAILNGDRRIIFTSPTGMGKSRCMTALIEWAASQWWRSVLYCHRRLLFDQTSGVLSRHGVDHGLRASGHPTALLRDTQLCMTQSEVSAVFRRKCRELHQANLVLSDELHAQGGDMLPKIHAQHYDQGAAIVGVTATPLDIVGEWDRLIVAGTTSEGRKCGALVPAVTYCPDEPDLKHVKNYRVGEDLTDKENAKLMMRPGVFGRVFEHWQRLNPDAKPTILFAPDVAGSIFFAEQFYKQGVPSAHIDAKQIWYNGEYFPSDDDMRHRVLKMTETGEVTVLTNRYVCLDEKTEVLTSSGWVGIDGMTHQHQVANWDNGRVWFSRPLSVIQRHRRSDEKMVVLETPRRSIRVTDAHELLYRTTRDGRFLKDTAIRLTGRSVAVPVSGIAKPFPVEPTQIDMLHNLQRRVTANAFAMRKRGHNAEDSRAEAERRLRARSALKRKSPKELTLEECELIGFWVGDGNRNRLASGGVEYRLSQEVHATQIVHRVDALIEAVGLDVVRKTRTRDTIHGPSTNVHWSISRGTGFGPQQRRGLFAIEPYLEKTGSDLWWGLDAHQFEALIRGLWMADGFPHNNNITPPRGGFRVCGAEPKLFDLLQAIAVCRGFRCSIRSYRQSNPTYTQPLLLLTMTKADEHVMTKHRMQIEDSPFRDERVWCVRTDSGNIITRRNGSATVMGNCREGIDLPHIAHCIFACVFGSVKTYLQSGGRAIRSHPSMSEVVVQDHGGNYTRHGSLNADRVWELGQSGYVTSGMREDAMRENQDLEPITCPNCGMARLSGPVCPKCGHRCVKRSRVVVQVNGSLKCVEGPRYRKRYIKVESDTEQKWVSMYHRARSKKWDATFRQAQALFCHENGYYPPDTMPFMPTTPSGWYEKCSQYPRDLLTARK